MAQPIFNSNKVARDLCEKFGLQQCVILGFSDAKGYEIVAAGANEQDAQIATEVAVGLKEGLTQTGTPIKLVV